MNIRVGQKFRFIGNNSWVWKPNAIIEITQEMASIKDETKLWFDVPPKSFVKEKEQKYVFSRKKWSINWSLLQRVCDDCENNPCYALS